MISLPLTPTFFFFNDTATTEIYTLSLHDALPISDQLHQPVLQHRRDDHHRLQRAIRPFRTSRHFIQCHGQRRRGQRSEEHTSELQSPDHLVCRLLLEKKKHSDTKDNSSTSYRVCI